MVKELWNAPQRELHYFGQELFFKYAKQFEKTDIALIEYMITHNSWWDTIDFIATKPLAKYFKMFPEERRIIINRWIVSENIWLQRSALLFQLKYKTETDLELLSYIILQLSDSKEFFIKKAIGWALREYSRTDDKWVLEFVNENELEPLSKREALKLIQTQ
jgi:3-methyladenine DNA glycosylase AlkD